MKLGFFTAALPGNTLEQAAIWGAESGFQAIERSAKEKTWVKVQ